tara:strand:+ start:663 stop:1004 length:342 start_codon:yes stop_codon:yes gene_type:complete
MSTYYRPTKPIPLQAIEESEFLEDIGFEVTNTKDKQYFYCGSYIHFSLDKENNVIDLYRYGGNNASKVLEPLEHEFEVEFISEYEDEYDDYDHPDTPVRKIMIEDLKNVQRNN